MMDAVGFLKTKNRMCAAYLRATSTKCDGCPLDEVASVMCSKHHFDHAEEAVGIVERWAEQHPVETRQSVFLGQYPETALDKHGIIQICPTTLFAAYRSNKAGCKFSDIMCPDCRRGFWMQEVE